MAACNWQTLHRKAVARFDQQEVRHDRLMRELKAQALNSNAALQAELDAAQCPECGLAFKEFVGTEDAQVLEIEVKAYRRVIHRNRYAPTPESVGWQRGS